MNHKQPHVLQMEQSLFGNCKNCKFFKNFIMFLSQERFKPILAMLTEFLIWYTLQFLINLLVSINVAKFHILIQSKCKLKNNLKHHTTDNLPLYVLMNLNTRLQQVMIQEKLNCLVILMENQSIWIKQVIQVQLHL